jgi:hypothetical protein
VLRRRAVRLIQLVADYGPGDLGLAETVQRIALAAPEAQVYPTVVAAGDTLAAGLCVADLALGCGPECRVVVHDVGGPVGDRRQWIGRTRDGTLVVGADRGWVWSFVAPGLTELCALEVPADADIALAVRRAVAGHPHAICAVVGRERVPAAPDCVVVWTDRRGNVQTTLATCPDERVMVRIGDYREPARVGAPAAGELVLEPGAHGLKRLALGGGSAAERFGDPAAGAPVEVTSAARAPRRVALQGASPVAQPRE